MFIRPRICRLCLNLLNASPVRGLRTLIFNQIFIINNNVGIFYSVPDLSNSSYTALYWGTIKMTRYLHSFDSNYTFFPSDFDTIIVMFRNQNIEKKMYFYYVINNLICLISNNEFWIQISIYNWKHIYF